VGSFWRNGGIAIAGVFTSILTAAIVALIDDITGFNLFGFSLWLIVPVGAVGCGFVAASGYYFSAKLLHQRPSAFLLIQMVFIAAITQFLIYWFEYSTLIIDGVQVSDRISFSKYLDVTLTSVHYRVGRAMIDTGQVGSFGYWLAAIDFVGFLLGGILLYIVLTDQPSCPICRKYMRTLAKKHDVFENAEAFAIYYDAEFAFPVDTPEFVNHVGAKYSTAKAAAGAVILDASVLSCPQCSDQAVLEKVKVFNGKEWKDVNEATRKTATPTGIDVSPVYQSGAAARVMQQARSARKRLSSDLPI
jgi:hypothetical protein